jgi:site-specific recombinase XerD
MMIDELPRRWCVFRCTPNRSWPDLPEPLRQHFGTLGALLERHGTRDGQRFLIGPDGRPDQYVNEFLSSLARRTQGEHTSRKYAYSLAIWLNFLQVRQPPRSWYEADSTDVEDLKFWRMTDGRNPRRVTGSTWHGDLAALSAFYTWATRKYSVRNPIALRELRHRRRTNRQATYVQAQDGVTSRESTVPTEMAAEPAGIRDSDPKWFTPRAYRRWVDWGLRGLGPDGRDAPVWRGRNSERDAAFADLLYGTGLRLQEGGSLLTDELPPLEEDRRFFTCRLADVCAKNSRGRRYWMPRAVREELDQYIGLEGERRRAIARAQRAHRYESLPDLRLVEELRGRTLRLRRHGNDASHDVPLDVLTPQERRRLFRETTRGLEPLALWLNEDGFPRAHHGWENTFQTANRRIRRLGMQNFVCRPHKLRHSFAFAWYIIGRLLYERQLGHLTADETRDFRVQFGNTWDLVRTLLGHASLETTMQIYLEPFQTLEVETLLETAAQLDPGMLDLFFRTDRRIRTDPLERL